MDVLHRDTRRVLVEARNQLESLEAASGNQGLDPAASSLVVESFRANVQQVNSNISALRSLLAAEAPSRREVWRARLRDLDDQVAELRAGDARCVARFREITTNTRMRQELLQRTHASGDAIIGLGPAEEQRSLDNSTSGVASIMSTGQGALNALLDQRKRLKGAKTKMLDVMNQMGVDRKIIAQIERRDYADMLLLYALMALILIVLFLAYLWKSHRHSHA